MTWRSCLATLLLLGIVLSPLRAVAATIPMLIAYDAAVLPTAATLFEPGRSLRSEWGGAPAYVYDDAHDTYDDGLTTSVVGSAGTDHAYDCTLKLAAQREVSGGGAVYGAAFPTVAAEGAVTVTQEGLAAVGEHLAQFGEYAPNTAMLDRLGGQVGSAVTGADANFYTHELLEAGHMASGMSYDAAHAAALEQAGVSPFSVFHPEVIQQFPAQFNNAWRAFWGL